MSEGLPPLRARKVHGSEPKDGPSSKPVNPGLEPFARRLIALRERRGLSAYAVARKAGLTSGAVCNLERAKAGPSAETLARLSGALGVTMDELWKGVGRAAVPEGGEG